MYTSINEGVESDGRQGHPQIPRLGQDDEERHEDVAECQWNELSDERRPGERSSNVYPIRSFRKYLFPYIKRTMRAKPPKYPRVAASLGEP